jgi:Ca2+-binding RTX toxin-like protein
VDAYAVEGSSRSGADRLLGGGGDDQLFGDAEQLHAGAVCGDDRLLGGMGDDQLWGDADPTRSDLADVIRGADRFVLRNDSGRDTIGDFEPHQDTIDLTGFKDIGSFQAIQAQAAQSGNDTVIDLGAAAGGPADQDVLTLTTIVVANLDASDFLLA